MADPRPRSPLYAEALAALAVASLTGRIVSFGKLARWSVRRSVPRPKLDPVELAAIQRTLTAWARRVPFRSKCLEQGLAASWMLSRRNMAATLYYGAANIDHQLKAHVWVRSGGIDVIGCENSSDFAILSQFSNDSSSSPVQSSLCNMAGEEMSDDQ
ncbi:MAG: lasso peptide biosynthesis B2 protein [Sphingomicrobium sp.]